MGLIIFGGMMLGIAGIVVAVVLAINEQNKKATMTPPQRTAYEAQVQAQREEQRKRNMPLLITGGIVAFFIFAIMLIVAIGIISTASQPIY